MKNWGQGVFVDHTHTHTRTRIKRQQYFWPSENVTRCYAEAQHLLPAWKHQRPQHFKRPLSLLLRWCPTSEHPSPRPHTSVFCLLSGMRSHKCLSFSYEWMREGEPRESLRWAIPRTRGTIHLSCLGAHFTHPPPAALLQTPPSLSPAELCSQSNEEQLRLGGWRCQHKHASSNTPILRRFHYCKCCWLSAKHTHTQAGQHCIPSMIMD